MHELSVALEVCRMAEARLRPEELRRLRQVGVLVGSDAGIEADNLEFCLEALLAAPPFGRAVPAITRTAGDDLALAWLQVDDDGPDD
jgi:Zn finger protein HypA/HybF involved in hydrogenase expression